jgi:uncharacterized protein HemX
MITTIGWIGSAVTARTPTLRTRPRQARVGHPGAPKRGRGDVGEGVISAAIAVLIMAFLGAAMWVGFQQMWKTTESTTNQKVEQIGSE